MKAPLKAWQFLNGFTVYDTQNFPYLRKLKPDLRFLQKGLCIARMESEAAIFIEVLVSIASRCRFEMQAERRQHASKAGAVLLY